MLYHGMLFYKEVGHSVGKGSSVFLIGHKIVRNAQSYLGGGRADLLFRIQMAQNWHFGKFTERELAIMKILEIEP